MNRNSFFIGFAAICFYLITSSVARGANDSEKERSQKHFKAGLSLLDTENYRVAAQEFESSVRLYPTKNGYFNLAVCYFELHRYNDAVAIIDRLKREFSDELDDAWQKEIESFESKLKGSIVPIELSINIEGAAIKLDGQEVGTTSKGAPLFLDPGDHVVTLTAEGYKSITETISVQAGQGRTVFHFVMVNSSEKTTDEEQEPEAKSPEQNTTYPVHFKGEESDKPKKKRRIGTAIAFSIGGACGIAAVTTGVIHLVGVTQIRDSCGGDYCADPGWKSSVRKMLRLGVATNVLIAISAVGFVAGTILAFVEGGSRDDKKKVSVAPLMWEEGGGLVVSGRF